MSNTYHGVITHTSSDTASTTVTVQVGNGIGITAGQQVELIVKPRADRTMRVNVHGEAAKEKTAAMKEADDGAAQALSELVASTNAWLTGTAGEIKGKWSESQTDKVVVIKCPNMLSEAHRHVITEAWRKVTGHKVIILDGGMDFEVID